MTDSKNATGNDGQQEKEVIFSVSVSELLKALSVLQGFLKTDLKENSATLYKELRQALIDAGVNAESIAAAAKNFPIKQIDISDQNGITVDVDMEHPEYFTEVEGSIIAYTAFFNTILQRNIDALTTSDLESLDHLQSLIPDKFVLPRDKISNNLTSEPLDGVAGQALVIKQRGKMKPVYTRYVLTYEGDNVKLSGRASNNYTSYDRAIQDAITTLWVHGDAAHIFTPPMIYRTMTGKAESEAVSPQQIGAITKSIEKQRRIHAEIDCTEEIARRGLHGVKTALDDFLISAEALTVEAGGRKVRAYKLHSAPILYSYANSIGQVSTVPAALLDIKKVDRRGRISTQSLPNTENRIQIKNYLLRRIEGMKNERNHLTQRTISLLSYERSGKKLPGIYEIAGYPNPTKQEAGTIRKYIEQVLCFWTASKYIKGYTFTKKGQTIAGVEISL